MNIRINGVPISFELEQEKTAGEVYDGVIAWLQSAGHRLEALRLNDEKIDDFDGAWRGTPVEEIADFDFDARSLREQQIEDLETIIHYTELLERVMREGSAEQRDAVLDELPHVAGGIARTTPDLAGLLDEPLRDGDHHDETVRERAARRAGEIRLILDGRQRELLDPVHEMRSTLDALDAILPTFEEIPGEIQSGDRSGAMDTVARFTELAARELRILPLIVETHPAIENESIDGVTLSESIPGMNELFSELESAFTNSDFVLIGDLLEYELLPRFTALHAVIRRYIDAER